MDRSSVHVTSGELIALLVVLVVCAIAALAAGGAAVIVGLFLIAASAWTYLLMGKAHAAENSTLETARQARQRLPR